MDIARPDLKRKKSTSRWVTGVISLLLIAALASVAMKMKPALPSVERGNIWTDSVKRGDLVQQVRGPGVLTPREDGIRLIPAQTDATVIRIRILPGTKVSPDTILMDLTDPQLQQELLDAALQFKAAQVDYHNLQAKLQSDFMAQKAAAATVKADDLQAQKQAQTDKALYDLGVISGSTYGASQGKSDELQTRNNVEVERLTLNKNAIATQLEVQQTKVDQAKALLGLKQSQLDALSVRAGIAGVLVDLPDQIGEHVTPGTTLAKVVQPNQLKASLKIPETQARDIQIGQSASIDTYNGLIAGKVARIDPAVQNGTVTVDIDLIGPLPQGARPDLSVDGTIALDKLTNVLYVGRPAIGNENSTVSLFRIDSDGQFATRTTVKLGRASVNAVQILNGLHAGDTVILSDMSREDTANRIHLVQ